jgi:hypothetical protein
MNIFVSYTLKDGLLSVNILQHYEKILSGFGNPYIDILHNNSLNPQEYVIRMLQESTIFCALITPKYFESNWVQIELNIATWKRIPVVVIDLISNSTIALIHQANTTLHRTAGSSVGDVREVICSR